MIYQLKKYIYQISKYKLFFFAIFSFISIIFGVIMPYINGKFLDYIIIDKNINFILKFALIIAIMSIVSVILNYVLNILQICIQTDIAFKFNHDVIQHMQKLPLLRVEKFDSVYLNQRINSDVNEISNFIINNAIVFSIRWIVVISELFFIYKINKCIFTLALIFVPIYCIIYIFMRKPIFKKNYELKEKQNTFFQNLNDQIEMIRSIKIDGTFIRNKERMKENYSKYFNFYLSYSKFMTILSSLDTIISVLFSATLLILGAIEIVYGKLTIGQFTIVSAYFNNIVATMKYYLDIGKEYQSAKAALFRIKELLKINEDHNGKEDIYSIESISLNTISFSYEDSDFHIIYNFSKKFFKDKIYIIKGSNGSGKSTLINILLGIIQDGVKGEVKYNSIETKKLDLYNIRLRHIAVVQQKMKFPNIKIRELLREFLDFQNDEELKEYIITRNLNALFYNHKFSIIKYLDKLVCELSGGELQKVAILRAILKDSDVLILDEPTSAFDKESVSFFMDTIKLLSKDKIIIIITHNSELEKIADEFIELMGDNIVEFKNRAIIV